MAVTLKKIYYLSLITATAIKSAVTYYFILKVTSIILYYVLLIVQNNSLGYNITLLHNDITVTWC